MWEVKIIKKNKNKNIRKYLPRKRLFVQIYRRPPLLAPHRPPHIIPHPSRPTNTNRHRADLLRCLIVDDLAEARFPERDGDGYGGGDGLRPGALIGCVIFFIVGGEGVFRGEEDLDGEGEV